MTDEDRAADGERPVPVLLGGQVGDVQDYGDEEGGGTISAIRACQRAWPSVT